MNNLRLQLDRAANAMGISGVLGAGLMLFCVGFALSWTVPHKEQMLLLHSKTQRLQHAAGVAPVTRNQQGPLTDFYGFFPSADVVPNALKKIFALAERQSLDISKSEFRLVPSIDANILTYQVRFPLRGSYMQIRKFVGAALQEFPFASLDELRLEKRRVEDPAVDCQIKFTFFLRAR